MIDPGYDMMTPKQKADIVAEVTGVLSSIWASHGDGKWKKMLLIKDTIADITLGRSDPPQGFRRHRHPQPQHDYLSDALAAQIGGIGIADPTSTTSPATPSSKPPTAPPPSTPTSTRSTPAPVVLSGEMMLRYMGWTEAADLIIKGMDGISAKTVTYDPNAS